jgi:hypothetical protein
VGAGVLTVVGIDRGVERSSIGEDGRGHPASPAR